LFLKIVSGLVHPGDIILQANGRDVKDPEKLQQAIEDSGEFIVFKIQPSSNLDSNGGNSDGHNALKSVNESKVRFLITVTLGYNEIGYNNFPVITNKLFPFS
jgi:hypothetical protein